MIVKAIKEGISYDEICTKYSTSKSTVSKIKRELGLGDRRVEGENVRAVRGSKIREHINRKETITILKDEEIRELAKTFLKIERKRLIGKKEREDLLVYLLSPRENLTSQKLENLKLKPE